MSYNVAANSRENMDRSGNSVVKDDDDVIIAALERIAPGSSQQTQTELDIRA